MKHIIISGPTSGLGYELVKVLKEDSVLHLIGRNLERIKKSENKKTFYYETDLGNLDEIKNIGYKILKNIITDELCDQVVFINNAGTINPLKKIVDQTYLEIEQSININLISPIVLIKDIFSGLNNFKEKKIVNISSGAANKAIKGWSLYSTGKAGINIFLKVLSEEEDIKIVSLDPGVMNTNMQKNIRNSKSEEFDWINQFKQYYIKNELNNPQKIAEQIKINYIDEWKKEKFFENFFIQNTKE